MLRRARRTGRAEPVLALILLLQTLTIVVSGPASSPEFLPLHVARAEGLFRQEGLDVTLRQTRAEPGAAEALAQGEADLVVTSLEAILRYGPRVPGQAPRLVFGLTAAPPVALVVPAAHAATVQSVEHLSGTRVGVSSPGAPEHAWLGWLLARAGLSVAQVSIVSHGSRGLGAALEDADVHAGLVAEPLASRLLAGGQARLLADLRSPAAVKRALGTRTVSAAVFARSDRMPRDADLAAVARALLAATRRLDAPTAEGLAQRLGSRITGPRDAFEARRAASRGLYLPDGLVTTDEVRQTLTLIRAHLPLPAPARVPDPDELLHVAPLEGVLTPRPGR